MLKTLGKIIDSQFLSDEVDSLVSTHEKLKREIGKREIKIANLDRAIEQRQGEMVAAVGRRNTVLGEIEGLLGTKVEVVDKSKILSYQRGEIARLCDEIDKLETHKRDIRALIDALNLELDTGRNAITVSLENYRIQRLEEIESFVEGERVRALESLKSSLRSEEKALIDEGEGRKASLRETLETIENQRVEVIKAFEGEIEEWEKRIDNLRTNHQREKDKILREGRELLEIEKRKFFNERDAEINRLEKQRISHEDSLKRDIKGLLEKHSPSIIGPYIQRIEALEEEMVSLYGQLTAKAEKSLDWGIGQIEVWLTKKRNGRIEPQHLRIAGESESGKSHLVNSLISQGLQHFGVEADYQIFDPFPSQSEWAIPPTIANDAPGVLEALQTWASRADDDSPGLDRPMILVVDEVDRLIIKFGQEMVSAIRSIWAGGRHKGIFLWAIGQNANVKKLAPLDWSDLDNASQIYLNSSGLQFLKNGLDGQNVKPIEGALAHLKSKSRYYAVVKSKGVEPYAVSRPLTLFPSPSPRALESSPGVLEPSPGPTGKQGLICAHCGSSRVQGAGQIKGRARVKCLECNRQSYGKTPGAS